MSLFGFRCDGKGRRWRQVSVGGQITETKYEQQRCPGCRECKRCPKCGGEGYTLKGQDEESCSDCGGRGHR